MGVYQSFLPKYDVFGQKIIPLPPAAPQRWKSNKVEEGGFHHRLESPRNNPPKPPARDGHPETLPTAEGPAQQHMKEVGRRQGGAGPRPGLSFREVGQQAQAVVDEVRVPCLRRQLRRQVPAAQPMAGGPPHTNERPSLGLHSGCPATDRRLNPRRNWDHGIA